MHDNADYEKSGVLAVLDRIEVEHHIQTMHQANMGDYLRQHSCECEAVCHCDDSDA